eukprot:m.1042499 g.1042499  ORF g.1042499 m.1042499 type:complete len:107 (+) comp24162_c1_seq43:841-1161(+)
MHVVDHHTASLFVIVIDAGDMQWRQKECLGSVEHEGRKWWEHKSWRDIERLLRREEAEFMKEYSVSKAAASQRAKKRKEQKAAQRRSNEARVSSGLDALRAKYGVL